jgi:hypothetical protein
MPQCFDPKTEILPEAQQEIWPLLAPAPRLSFVLYGGTAVALYLGHRRSVDFDFFRSEPLDKKQLAASFEFIRDAQTIQEDENTLVVIAQMPSGPVKVSFFGGLAIGRINEPLQTTDSTLLVASIEDLLVTKLKAIIDRAEAKDYRDISAILSARVSLEKALGAFAKIYGKDPGLPLKAVGYFKDGDLPSLPKADQDVLRAARDLRALIRRMSMENPLWGAPRIHGELLKLGFEVAQSSVAKYMVIRDKPTAPASPWQNGFAERLIGSIRRECVDHFIFFGEAHLRHILRIYARYYNDIRTHRSLDKEAPVSRPVQRTGSIKSHPILGGLHHQYLRV